MVMLDHVEKLVPSKITVNVPVPPVKEEQDANPKDAPKRGRKPKEE